MSKHLLITYAWSVNNIGDMGITPGLLNLLAETKPDLPVKIFSWLPEKDPGYLKTKKYLPRYSKDCEVFPMPFVAVDGGGMLKGKAWKTFEKRWGAWKLESFQKGILTTLESEAIVSDILNVYSFDLFEELKQENPAAVTAFENAGFVYYNSGTTFNFGRLGVKNFWNYTMPLAMSLIIARRLGIPYGIGSQSFDALEWPVDTLYSTLFNDAEFVYCRDSDSLNYLCHRVLTNKSSGWRPDTTFFFNGFDEAWAETFLAEHALEEKKYLCVMLRISDEKPDFNDPTGGTVSEERQLDHMRKMKNFLEQWIEKSSCKVLLCHETRGTLISAKTRLYDILSKNAQKQCVYMDEFWTSEQAYSVFKHARIITSMEMHSIIMSLNVGTPAIHNPYDECGRKKWMLRDLGLGDWLVDIDSPSSENDMLEAAMNIHENYRRGKERIKKLLPDLKVRALETLSEVWSHWKE